MNLKVVARRSFMIGGILFAIIGFWGLNALRININASTSMPDHAYIMWTWPQLKWHGMVIAADPPDAYRARFKDYYFTKRIYGVPGDIIEHRDGAVCIGADCFALVQKNGKPIIEPLAEGTIPSGFYAAFGSSQDSLDSRYASVGLFPAEKILATGFGTNLIPHWTELKTWLASNTR